MMKFKSKRIQALILVGIMAVSSISPLKVQAQEVLLQETSEMKTVNTGEKTAAGNAEESTGESEEEGTEEGRQGESREEGTEEGRPEESKEEGTEEGQAEESREESTEETTEEAATEGKTEETAEEETVETENETEEETKEFALEDVAVDNNAASGNVAKISAIHLEKAGDWSKTTSVYGTDEGTAELSENEWTEVTGTLTIQKPEEWEALGQIIIAFGGTSGTDYCVDKFMLEVLDDTTDIETSIWPEDYQPGFSGAGEDGVPFWWYQNTGAMAQRIEDKTAPDGDNFCMRIVPNSDGAGGQITVDTAKVPGILENKTYRYCYYAKLYKEKENEEIIYGDNLISNPNFEGDDFTMWSDGIGSANIAGAVEDSPVFDDITTYGVIGSRTSSQECFAQDITGKAESGKTYEYSFYVKLSETDYADAPAAQREISFAPYVKAGDTTTYWGSYSSGVLDSKCTKQIQAGEWVKFEGSFTPSYEGTADKLVIRILEQGTDYGSGECVKGEYYVTGVTLREKNTPPKEIEWDIPNLKDAVSSENGIGTEGYTGVSVVQSELTDKALMDLVEKHFNAVTLGNELKVDALFGYNDQNKTNPGTETVSFTFADGTTDSAFQVPVLDYSRAEAILDVIKEWNTKNPTSEIKVRGHVLVWHSQTPEWFFHEDWNASKPYVSKEVMNRRLEWYTATVLTHFTGPDSAYKGMFYGWDVVNEAVSDGGGYRKDTENGSDSLTDATHGSKSSWWHVYQSEEFIVNAFRYANKYAPKELELYYNDYNECNAVKRDSIVTLLQTVKKHETDEVLPTRITGMGMQGHYNMESPSIGLLEAAVRAYGEVVGKVQLTELDLKASNGYDGTAAALQDEYTKQAYRYKEIYEVLRKVDAENNGIDINGITIWGVIDGNSWLQSSSSVGGGADGTNPQVPLLFDDDYKAKPAFYAFVNPDVLEPFTQKITVVESIDTTFANGTAYSFAKDDVETVFVPVWENGKIKVDVTVYDKEKEEGDQVTVYVDWENTKGEKGDSFENIIIKRGNAEEIEGGYHAVFEFSKEVTAAQIIGMDVVVQNKETLIPFNDLQLKQENSSKYYAQATLKPFAVVGKGSVVVDAKEDSIWKEVKAVPLTIRTGNAKAEAKGKLLWDDEYLYAYVEVADENLDSSSAQAHEQDSIEFFIDENNNKSDSYEADDKQYRINFLNEQSYNGEKCNAANSISKTRITGDNKGYVVEAAFRWTDIVPEEGDRIGFEMQINDGEGGSRIGTVSWYDESGNGWSTPGVFGSVQLGDVVVSAEDASYIENFVVFPVEDQIYTGGAVKPSPVVKNKGKTLVQGVDYTVSYAGNVNVNTVQKKEDGIGKNVITGIPVITIKGKGNFKETVKLNFNIKAKQLPADAEALEKDETMRVTYSDVIKKSSKAMKPSVSLYYNNKKLAANKAYTLSYKNKTTGEVSESIPKNEYGEYSILVTAKGNNFTGETELPLQILGEENTPVSKLKIQLPKTVAYTYADGTSVVLDEKQLIVKDGSQKLERTQKESGKDGYYCEYKNNTAVGTASVIITGTGKYCGSITKTFKITGAAVSGVTVTLFKEDKEKVYNGTAQQLDLSGKLTYKVKNAQEAAYFTENKYFVKKKDGEFAVCDETTVIAKNSIIRLKDTDVATALTKGGVQAGKATYTVTGMGFFTGTKKITVTIAKEELKSEMFSPIADRTVLKGGVKPEISGSFAGEALVQGKDFTVSYNKNKAVGTAKAVVKGKGSFKGSVTLEFNIRSSSMKEVSVSAPDIAATKKGAYKAKITVYDADGKKLQAGKDYEKTIQYYMKEDNDWVEVTSSNEKSLKAKFISGTIMKAVVTGKGNYAGENEGERSVEVQYSIAAQLISNATIKVKDISYTGKKIMLTQEDFTRAEVRINGVKKQLVLGEDFEIVYDAAQGYTNKGNYKIKLIGKTVELGGEKTVSFKVTQKGINKLLKFFSIFN